LFGLFYHRQMMDDVEQSVVGVTGETEILRENLPPCRFAHKFHITESGSESGPPQWEPTSNRLSYFTFKPMIEEWCLLGCYAVWLL
jgi:hypothetical protein